MPSVRIIEIYKGKWEIVTSEKGVVLKTDIFLANAEVAQEYVRAYCSSWRDWTFEVVPLEKQ